MTAHATPLSRLAQGDVPEHHSLRRLETLARVLDTALPIPFLAGRRIGLDALIGFVPVVGDLIATVISGYLILEAKQLGLPKRKMVKMAINTGIDGAIGTIPIVGDIFDIFFRANDRNMRIIYHHLATDGRLVDPTQETQPS
jgi:hypothetical protein